MTRWVYGRRCRINPAFRGSRRLLAILWIWLLFAFVATAASQPVIRWVTNDVASPYVEVTGVSKTNPKELSSVLKVYAEQDDLTANLNALPMLGSHTLEGDTLRFTPAFPLQRGVHYLAVFKEPSAKRALNSWFQLPKRALQASTVVSKVYPSASVLPENLLKFYVYFSAPMSRGQIYSHIHLLDEKGDEVQLPFLELDEELWDPSMTRLTLFIDPGRIKREVRPLEEIGPSLTSGKRYTLRIDPSWLDAQGARLKAEFKKSFQVGPPDREPPDPKKWKVQAPQAMQGRLGGSLAPAGNGREPLKITFGESMDHALAQRLIHLTGPDRQTLKGQCAVEDEERRWVFTPAEAWKPGEYRIHVQTTIEDLAGNNIGKPFEVDLFSGVQRKITNSFTTLTFVVRESAR